MNGKGYGMPSSHSQFIAFFAVTTTLFLLLRHTPPPPEKRGPHTPLPYWQRILLSVSVIAVAAAMGPSRIYLSYHTPFQVVVGISAGIISAVIWYAFTALLRSEGWIDWALETKLARLGRWRDLVIEEDLVEGGWRRWVEKRKSKMKTNDFGKILKGQ